MTNKTDTLVQELIDANFPAVVYANMTERQKECVRSAISSALIVGGVQMTSMAGDGEYSPLVIAIAQDAREFEKTLDYLTNTNRIPSVVYPWGWHYQDDDVQKKFREFCTRSKGVES